MVWMMQTKHLISHHNYHRVMLTKVSIPLFFRQRGTGSGILTFVRMTPLDG